MDSARPAVESGRHWPIPSRVDGPHIFAAWHFRVWRGDGERSHRIDQKEFYRMLEGVVIDDTELFNERLKEWEDFYNYNRPHGALGGQTPQRLRERTTSPV